MSYYGAIVAASLDGVIGVNNTLPWHSPKDLKRFKDSTVGKTLVMGRKTWESLPPKSRPLPDRTNIILTRDKTYKAEGAIVLHSVEEVDTYQKEHNCFIWVIGGAEIYALFESRIDVIQLTEVHVELGKGTKFPINLKDGNWEASALPFTVFYENNGKLQFSVWGIHRVDPSF